VHGAIVDRARLCAIPLPSQAIETAACGVVAYKLGRPRMLLHSPLAVFVAQAAVVIAVSRLIGVAARRLAQPLVIAEILAGIVLGPSLLGAIAPGAMDALFPSTSLALLGTVSQLGLLLFMFLVGLELDPKLLKGRAQASLVISHTSIVVPCVFGGLLGLYLYPRLSTPDVPFASFIMFMGVSMSVTAFPVLARILSERRLLQSKVGAIAITCAAVDDVTAWCLLAFVVSVAKATGLAGAVFTVVLALVYIAAMLGAVRPILLRFAAQNASHDALTQGVVAITLLMLLASSLLTELIGIHALFGGFLLGAIMPKEGHFARLLAEKLEDLVVVLLLPMFFAYSGLRTQIGLLDTGHAWVMCGLIILVACVGKFGGSVIAGRLTGLGWREAGAVGILMNTRGLVELIVLNIGLDLKVISPALFTMLVIMALVTTFMTTPLLELVYPAAELVKELAAGLETAGAQAQFTALMCVAFERTGPAMITLVNSLVPRHAGSHRLYALRLIRPSERASFYLMDRPERGGLQALQPLMNRADELRLAVKPIAFVSPRPARDICDVAEAKGANLIVLGWHKPVLARTVLGGTVAEVLEKAASDVAIFIDRGLTNVRRVLVPFQGTPDDKAALTLARRMTVANIEVTILHVIKPGRTEDERLGAQHEIEHTFTEEGPWKRTSVRMKLVSHETPAIAAIEEAARGYDLVVVGAGHEWGLGRRLLGLAPELMVERCGISLLLVRQYDAARASAHLAKVAPVTT
jgi:Kef-type K+ transport system membrane component KefB/nucleotide-binding universal stress UspA family protein